MIARLLPLIAALVVLSGYPEEVFEGEITVTLTGVDAAILNAPVGEAGVRLDGVVGYRVDLGADTYEVGGVDEREWYDEEVDWEYRESFYVLIEDYAGPGSYPATVEARASNRTLSDSERASHSIDVDATHCTAEVGEDELLGGVECDVVTLVASWQNPWEGSGEDEDEDGSLSATWVGGFVPGRIADPARSDTSAPQ
ncbi:MAG: hypothetical protein GY898_04185 [Proteobacteria bacterium]|nr:hypothetical protein [Pseudomonadota bacterium]